MLKNALLNTLDIIYLNSHDCSNKCTPYIRGYRVYYEPKIEYNTIDTYQKPEVKFDHGVNVKKYILAGLIGGGVIGLVTGLAIGGPIGVAIGGIIGAVVGGVAGGIKALKEIEKVPVESITLNYKEPIYENKEIGKIPESEYISKSKLDDNDIKKIINAIPTKSIIQQVPLKDENGKVIYKEIQKTFSGHGKPVVSYKTEEVKEPILQGWKQSIKADVYCS